jgi:hypothetical protein
MDGKPFAASPGIAVGTDGRLPCKSPGISRSFTPISVKYG